MKCRCGACHNIGVTCQFDKDPKKRKSYLDYVTTYNTINSESISQKKHDYYLNGGKEIKQEYESKNRDLIAKKKHEYEQLNKVKIAERKRLKRLRDMNER